MRVRQKDRKSKNGQKDTRNTERQNSRPKKVRSLEEVKKEEKKEEKFNIGEKEKDQEI